ncbi:MAG: DUF2156 domain-containing protein [Candidatus Zhuqueibacterota bacterium]
MIPTYPNTTDINLTIRELLHPAFQTLTEGISEFSFANIYLFRKTHNYRISKFSDDHYIILGNDADTYFFMLPFGLPDKDTLESLFRSFHFMKAVSENQIRQLESMGYGVVEDRDNFDYLYSREELANLAGRKFHKKKNLVNAFINQYTYEGKPLLDEYIGDALNVLEQWRAQREDPGDYEATKEALERAEELQLCGGIYYVEGEPAAFTLGEELALGKSFVIHFEKALGQFKGIYQFVNQCFAAILPEKYNYINREQDLGNDGLRQAKLSYRPVGFVKKYRVIK